MADITNQQLLDSLTSQFGIIANTLDAVATKDDLKGFVTKDDLKNELKAFATKDDLKGFATKDDLEQVESRLGAKIDQVESKVERLDGKVSSFNKVNIKHHLETRGMIGELNQKQWPIGR